ncbi:hypothetical protein [Candidatus Nitrotoga sp. 1052]|uniref:hypothetical protein n=1 Tax=Candidatus Nitrotoga sp. 1052 TaxID=2886964 RepID=UPI001EF53265|nr:hypothetical protein [Candidatus Nitrotoga sp. 1052]
MWTLPDGDADFPTRWMMIKRAISLACREIIVVPAGWLHQNQTLRIDYLATAILGTPNS